MVAYVERNVALLIFNRDIKYDDKWLSAHPSRFLVKKKTTSAFEYATEYTPENI
jgi:hypothetical protein